LSPRGSGQLRLPANLREDSSRAQEGAQGREPLGVPQMITRAQMSGRRALGRRLAA
jgi:hypothetical protein